MNNLRERLKKEILFLDGATGTNLQRAGMPAGVCPELWILEHPDVLIELQKSYIRAGSQIIYAPTFSGNSVKLKEYGVKESVKEINQRLVALSKRAVEEASHRCLVAGDITMTGQPLAPMGEMDFEELVDIYKEQVTAIAEAGADLIVVETMMSIQECRAAVLAVKEATELPVFVTITLENSGRTLYGTDPVTALITMEALGVDAFGLNCSSGPDTMLPLIRKMASYATVPLIAKPNAGLPRLENGRTVFDMPKDAFADGMKELVEAGATVVGGCCGTDPSYIEAMEQRILERCRKNSRDTGAGDTGMDTGGGIVGRKAGADSTGGSRRRLLSCERSFLEFTLDGPFHIVGERINPTGKKKLQAELLAGSLDMACDMARDQVRQGASILDINVGMGGIDEQAMMLRVIEEAGPVAGIPLCIDSSNPEVIAAALRRYPGRALVNSVSCEKVKIEKLLPIVKKYGAMFVLLPLKDNGLPKNQAERWENIQYVWEKARALGFAKEDIVVDGLVAAVAAEPMAARDTLATVARCHQEGFATICGLSNISFGLPERSYVNAAFLSMAIAQGLTMAISNPSQELFQHSRFAADLLMGKDLAAVRYVEDCQKQRELQEKQPSKNIGESAKSQPLNHVESQTKNAAGSETGSHVEDRRLSQESGKQDSQTESQPSGSGAGNTENGNQLREAIRQDVRKGRAKQAAEHIGEALSAGEPAKELLDQVLIPAINEVGELFNQQKYFLPQLILSAKAMEEGVAVLEPVLMEAQGDSQGPTVVIATVKGDIHDIGKNLVAMMMKNYGFRVFDLGKDVDKETIVAAAREHHADVIGLSALMTTTMTYMKEVIEEVHRQGLDVKVIVGGAAVTQDYATQIGADGYSEDAVGAVELVKRLMG